MKVKYIQMYSNECGICSINNLLNLYGYKKVSNESNFNKEGMSIYEMCGILSKYFNNVKAVSFDINQIKKVKTFSPFIVLIKKDNISHYLVIYKKNTKYLFILDSLTKKSYKITYDTFSLFEEKIFIICEDEKKLQINNSKLPFIKYIPIISLIESLFLLSTTILIQQIIDNGKSDAIIYIAVQIILLLIMTYKAKCFLKTFSYIDNNLIRNTVVDIYNLKKEYIDKYDINEVYYRINDAYSYKGMYLSLIFNIISDVVLAICTIILMFIYSLTLSIVILLACLIIIVLSIYIFNKTKDIIERKRITEYSFINYYIDSFNNIEKIYENGDKKYENETIKLLKEYQILDYKHEKISIIKNLLLTYFQTFVICLIVIIYFSKLYSYISIGSLIALINLVTLVLQPILNICSQITIFSNHSLIKKRLKDIESNVK